MNRAYHDKEIKVFEAVFALAKSGIDFEAIRIQKIAEQSQIAKGTIYEYFGSKEEIIDQTIAYYLYQEMQSFQELLVSKYSFVELIEFIMDKIRHNKASCSSFEILFKYSSKQQVLLCSSINSYITTYLNELVDKGKSEGFINKSIEDSYARHVLIAVFSSYNITMSFEIKDNETVKQQSIRMMISSLL